MPSPRSVLHDITVQGLDPNQAHSRTNGAGQLKATHHVEHVVVEKVEKTEKHDKAEKEKKAEKKKPEPKPGLVKLHCEECNKESDCECICDKCYSKPVAKKDVDSAS